MQGFCWLLYIVSGLKHIDINHMVCNEHVNQELKRKYAGLIDLLPEEFRKGYSMYVTNEGDPEISAKYEKFITDPYFAPLMAESLKGTQWYIFSEITLNHVNLICIVFISIIAMRTYFCFHNYWSLINLWVSCSYKYYEKKNNIGAHSRLAPYGP